MNLSVGCILRYRATQPTPLLFNVEAMLGKGQSVSNERLVISPSLPNDVWTDTSGNRFVRLIAPQGELSLTYDADVATSITQESPGAVGEVPIGELPQELFPYLSPSRYCQSDKLQRFARDTFCQLPPGYQRVAGICNWIRDYVTYESGSTNAMTSAIDTVTERVGVCRDFAHLSVALCRALSIPARYVSAYALGLTPPDFHAGVEAYLRGPEGDGWYLFDATRMVSVDRLVRIGVGRDAADIAFCTAFGGVAYDPPQVWVKDLAGAPQPTTDAVRLA
jgi:transglutaminase-like putative cysteine protease